MKIKAPEGWKSFSMHGTEHYPDEDGTYELPNVHASFLIKYHGFTEVPRVPAPAVQGEEAKEGNSEQ